MKDFDLVSVSTVEEAVRILKRYGTRAVINAGGTDLLGVLRDRILPYYPEAVINIKTIDSLQYIREESEGLIIGAGTCLADIAQSEVIQRTYPVLAEAAKAVATPQIRNMATLGGNICQDVRCWYYRYPDHIGGRMMCLRKGGKGCFAVRGDNRYHAILGVDKCFAVCPSDTAIALAALDARISITKTGATRVVPLSEFYQKTGNILRTGEMVTDVRIPKPLHNARQVFKKFTLQKPVDFAITSVACVLMVDSRLCNDARIVLGAVAPVPLRAISAEETIRGKTLDETRVSAAADAAVAGSRPLTMNVYKVQITKTLVKRALLEMASQPEHLT